MSPSNRLKKKTTVVSELGIHARPAARIARMAGDAKKTVWLEYESSRVDAANVIEILSLGCVQHKKVIVEIETQEDMEILDQIVTFFESGFGDPGHENT